MYIAVKEFSLDGRMYRIGEVVRNANHRLIKQGAIIKVIDSEKTDQLLTDDSSEVEILLD